MSSFFKNLGDTVAKTAGQVGAKSAELMNAGKEKVEQMQLESKIKGLKTELGGLVYESYKTGEDPNSEKITVICEEIKQVEELIAALGE